LGVLGYELLAHQLMLGTEGQQKTQRQQGFIQGSRRD
jgi:hypothetical protein